MYQISARILTTGSDRVGEWHGCIEIPTFYLDERVQGITDTGHAERIAATIVNPGGTHPGNMVLVTACRVEL